MSRWILAATGAAIVSMTPALAGSFVSFDMPGSTGTFPEGVSISGIIAGSYLDSGRLYHGFVRAADGSFKTFDPPKSQATLVLSVSPKRRRRRRLPQRQQGRRRDRCAYRRRRRGAWLRGNALNPTTPSSGRCGRG